MHRVLAILLVVFAGFSMPAEARMLCRVWRALSSPFRPAEYAGPFRWGKELGTSVEMEVTEVESVFKFATVKSPDGTIREILADLPVAKRPAWLTEVASRLGVAPERVPWDALSFTQQKTLVELAAVATNREMAFLGAPIRPIPWLAKDGTVTEFLKVIPPDQLPEWFSAQMEAQGVRSPYAVHYDKLPAPYQRELVYLAAAEAGIDKPFFGARDRKVPWLTWKDVTIDLGDGKAVRLRDVLHPEIEFGNYGSAQGVGKLQVIEMHVNGREREPEQTWQLTKKIQSAMGFRQPSTHLHITFPMPEKFLREDPKVHSAAMTRQWALMNLLVDLESRAEKLPMENPVDPNGLPLYTALDRNGVHIAGHWLLDAGEGKFRTTDDALKMADIGLRDWSLYQRPEGIARGTARLMGWELRFINPRQRTRFVSAVVKRTKEINIDRQWAIPGEAKAGDAIREWQKRNPDKDPTFELGAAYPHWGDGYYNDKGAREEVISNAPPATRPVLDHGGFELLQKLSKKHHDVWMLTHDWERHSEGLLFKTSPQFHEQMRKAQVAAIMELRKELMHTNDAAKIDSVVYRVMLRFQVDSKIYDTVREAAGVPK